MFTGCAWHIRWLHGLIETYAEPNPDKPEVHLPMGMKSDVHNMYMEEVRLGENDLQPVSGNYFNAVWRERVPELKVRAFHRCVRCFCVSLVLCIYMCTFHTVPSSYCLIHLQVCRM